MVERVQHNYLYVQRLELPREGHPGLHVAFMGRTEYDVDGPRSYQRMGTEQMVATSRPVRYQDVERTVYFLGEKSTIYDKIDDFLLWVSRDMPNEEDSCYFELEFGMEKPSWVPATVVWWAIYDDFVWSLSKEALDRFGKGFTYGL